LPEVFLLKIIEKILDIGVTVYYISIMKTIKSFRISKENLEKLQELSQKLDRTEGWIINQCLEGYYEYISRPRNIIETKTTKS